MARVARVYRAGEHATLRAISAVASRGLTALLRWMCWWGGLEPTPADTGASVELNRDFTSTKITPDELRAGLQAYQDGAISFEALYANVMRGELARPGVGGEDERRAIDAAIERTKAGGAA